MIEKLFLAILPVTMFVTAAQAQSNPEHSILAVREEISDIKTRSIELERVKRDAERRSVSESFRSNFPEIKEDFERIQKLNSEISELALVKTPLSYSTILKSASDINRRAARLKRNLFVFNESAKQEPKAKQQNLADETLLLLLNKLDKSIVFFSHSPIFTNANLLNSQDSLRAQNDLEKIIEISSAIKQQTKKMIKKEN